MALGEFGRIATLFAPLTKGLDGTHGLSDDGATISVPKGRLLAVTTDAIVEGVHFLPNDAPEDIARKLLRVNLSDLAAMGATPWAYSLVAGFDKNTNDAWVEAFASGLAADQAVFGISLVGGDTVSTPGPRFFSVNAMGLTVPETRCTRADAKVGDGVFVTGTIGDAVIGLDIDRDLLTVSDPEDRRFLVQRRRIPIPRISAVSLFAEFANGAVDVSDGLVADAGHIAKASGTRLVIEAARVPLSEPARRVVERGERRLADLLTGGDDYEVVFTVPESMARGVSDAANAIGLPITRIGTVEANDSLGTVVILDADGSEISFERTGWTHA